MGCGEIDGADVGLLLGWPDGCPEGCTEGRTVGREESPIVGAVVGRHVGVCPRVLYVKLAAGMTLLVAGAVKEVALKGVA